jgi:hypothetical protein
MFDEKMESRNEKIPPQTLCFFLFFIVVVFFEKSCRGTFLYLAVKALKMAAFFGECGRECLSGPGNSV